MKFLHIALLLIVASCASATASKNTDLRSPCAGCDERSAPTGNLKYLYDKPHNS